MTKINKKEEDIKKKLEECIKEKEEYLDGWRRAKADFINYKQESIERIEKVAEYREEIIISEILKIVDDFKVAKKEIPEDYKNDNLINGFLQISNQLDSLLKKFEVKEIDSVGKQFDPNFHEAVELIEGIKEKGSVLEEISKGYIRKGRVLRPAKVKVIK